ncbi:MAG: hypothetical protein Q9218_002664 [Villophora microphyllina]
MSAPPGPRASRGSRPSSRARGIYQPRSNRATHTQITTRKADPPSSSVNGATSRTTRPSSRSGATRGPSSRATTRGPSIYRSQSRQIRNNPRPTAPKPNDLLRDATTQEPPAYRRHMDQIFTTLGEQRTQERKDAIRHGLLADPDKPTTLANAITIIGTCNDMCAEYERVQRVVQFMVDDCEKIPHATKEDVKVPSEYRMVKRYRRPAAGYEEQLPSDIRPPATLQKTLDYLMDELVGGPEPLANVHKFVWDRTRAIRNDFSIQQVTKIEELRIAISCFERIARFHILSLHQLAGVADGSIDFDAYQEREQLNNTLLSLMYYYDDSRRKLRSPNEAEFRAYCIIFEIEDQRPDLEDRAQNWPAAILKDRRVQTALKLYADAANASDAQGPLRPQAPNALARANTAEFFSIVQSPAVPYLMACVTEIYFNKVRRTALDTIWKAYKVKRGGNAKIEDWTLPDVTEALGFDDGHEAQTFCEEHGFTVAERNDGEYYVDLGSVNGRYLSDKPADTNRSRKQIFSTRLVEQKRRGRTLPAVINGLTAAQAQAQGLVEDYSENQKSPTVSSRRSSISDEETLFIPNGSAAGEAGSESRTNGSNMGSPTVQGKNRNEAVQPSPLSQPFALFPNPSESEKPGISKSSTLFGKPTTSSQPANQLAPPFSTFPSPASSSPFHTNNQPKDSSNLVNFQPQSDSIPGSVGNPKKPNPTALSFDATKSSTSQGQANPTATAAPPRSILDLKPSSASNTPKLSFATSPLFSQVGKTDASQTKSKNAKIDFSPRPSFPAGKPSQSEQQPSESPFKFLDPSSSASTATAPTPLSQSLDPAPVSTHHSAQGSPQRPFSSFFPPNWTSNITSTPSSDQSNPAVTDFDFGPTQPAAKSSDASAFFPVNDILKPSQQSPFQKAPSPSSSTTGAQPASASGSTTSLFTPKPPKSIAAAPPPDPRPTVLDALAEGLMMGNQGLLQQFIEYTIGPIVHEAFREVEAERSWKRAREIRAILLGRKYSRRWKDNAWKRKLLRKGRERREIFAKSLLEMSRSSRMRQSQNQALIQPRLMGSYLYPEADKDRKKHTGPPAPPLSDLKRKSLPSDFGDDNLPDAEANNKRRRQEPPEGTKDSKPLLDRSFQPHHQRSKTMGDSQKRPESIYARKPDFRHLDENTHINERALQKARRLVGTAKLDTTRGDYFQLKSRGINPDTLNIPDFSSGSGGKRSRVDEQIERVRKLLKPSLSAPKKPTSLPEKSFDQSTEASFPAHTTQATAISASTINSANPAPNDLLAQIRKVREQLAEGTSWFKEEREKGERASSSRSSEVTPNPQLKSSIQLPTQSNGHQPRQRDSAATRARLRLEKTKANGLLPPDWDWNKSVTEWKARGGVDSPRPNRDSRRQTGASTAAEAREQQKKPLGLAGVTNGLGKRAEKVSGMTKEEVVYDDEDEVEFEDFGVGDDELEDDVEGEEGEEEDYVNGYEEVVEEDYDEEEYDEEEEEEEEEADDVGPAPAVLKTQGASAATAIDLDLSD